MVGVAGVASVAVVVRASDWDALGGVVDQLLRVDGRALLKHNARRQWPFRPSSKRTKTHHPSSVAYTVETGYKVTGYKVNPDLR